MMNIPYHLHVRNVRISAVIVHMAVAERLILKNILAKQSSIAFEYELDGSVFHLEAKYQSISLSGLEAQLGSDHVQRLYAVMGFFLGLSFCSFAPREYDVEAYGSLIDSEAVQLFQQLYRGIFAQHRWENQLFDYRGPTILGVSGNSSLLEQYNPRKGADEFFVSSSMGKDSLVMMKFLEDLEIPFSTYSMGFTLWGEDPDQKDMDSLLDVCVPLNRHWVEVSLESLEEHMKRHYSEKVATVCSPATPNALFLALPVIVMHGYQYLLVGNEMSADIPNFFDERMQQDVNHQWGKSLEAEKLMSDYLSDHLLQGFHFFSLLKPFSDRLIFTMLAKHQHLFKMTNSCNLRKTWCKDCAKCVYVWLQSLAYLERQTVDDLFQMDLFSSPQHVPILRELVGLDGFKPFECVGEVEESQLAVAECIDRGYTGPFLDEFKEKLLSTVRSQALRNSYSDPYAFSHRIPQFLWKKMDGYISQLEE